MNVKILNDQKEELLMVISDVYRQGLQLGGRVVEWVRAPDL